MSLRPLQEAAELLRLIHNLARFGTIAEVDHAAARVRVATGEITTTWLPWQEARAGTTRTWCPPTLGEQVLIVSPGGDMASGLVFTGLYRDAHPAPVNSPALWHAVMPDGAVIEYDHVAHHLRATIPGSVEIDASGEIDIISGADITVTAAGILRMTAAHIHLNEE
jgi:phage baseplate assembly protein V